ncbi:MAG: hypothetical protein EHM35_15435, partial [Planctomycetaceae bacterium]
RAKGFPLFIALPILVAGWERLQGFPMGGFYWRFLGHSQYQNLAMIQIADILGAAGVSFVVAMVNGLLVDLIQAIARARQRPIVCLTDTPSPGIRVHPWQVWTILRLVSRDAGPLLLAGSKPSSTKSLSLRTGVVAVVVTATFLYGQWRLRQAEECVTEGPLVASLQSNVPISVKRSFKASEDIFEELMAKSQAAASVGANLIVWPETMVQGNLQPELWSNPQVSHWDWEEAKAFHKALGEHAKDNAYLLVGAYGGEILRDSAGKDYFGKYNSAYFYRPDGAKYAGRYDKIHLVLFGEYIPFRRSIPWVFEQLGKFLPEGYNPDYSLEHGRNYTIFEMGTPIGKGEPNSPVGQSLGDSVKAEGPGDGSTIPVANHRQAALDNATLQQSAQASPYRFAVIICYEDTVPYVARTFALDDQGRKRIDWLVNISNDGWFVRFITEPERVVPSTELPQHAAICAFRAVENRLPILRSVNTGISCLIESTGRIRNGYLAASDGFPSKAMNRTGLTGWFSDKMPIDTRVTFYSRHGEWLANGCSAVLIAIVVGLWAPRLIRRKPSKAAR